MAVKPIPEGYHTCTPYLIMQQAEEAIEFYKKALDAKEIMRLTMPDTGKIGHAEIQIGDSRIMLSNEAPDMGYRGPKALGGTPVSLHLYVEDVDAAFKKAIAAGGKEQRPVADQFYGDRSGTFVDPFGHIWHLSTHVRDVSEEELAEAMKQYSAKKS
jgi:PhnB protein